MPECRRDKNTGTPQVRTSSCAARRHRRRDSESLEGPASAAEALAGHRHGHRRLRHSDSGRAPAQISVSDSENAAAAMWARVSITAPVVARRPKQIKLLVINTISSCDCRAALGTLALSHGAALAVSLSTPASQSSRHWLEEE
jgi:hypothetical protein